MKFIGSGKYGSVFSTYYINKEKLRENMIAIKLIFSNDNNNDIANLKIDIDKICVNNHSFLSNIRDFVNYEIYSNPI